MNSLETIISDISAAISESLGKTWFQIAVIIFVALVVQALVQRYISRFIERAVKSHKYESAVVEKMREKTLNSVIGTAVTVMIWLVTIVFVLAALNVNIAALATGAGLIGVIFGFGAQSTVKDFLAGIFIIAENQYRIGDIIELSCVSITSKTGVVEDITVRITRLRDLDGNVHVVPNGIIYAVTNMSFEYANVVVDLGVAYESDIDKVISVINDVGLKMTKTGKYKDDIIDPIKFLRVDSFGESSVKLKALGKVAPGLQWDIAGEFRHQIKLAFAKNDIEIPYPQRVIHTLPEKKK